MDLRVERQATKTRFHAAQLLSLLVVLVLVAASCSQSAGESETVSADDSAGSSESSESDDSDQNADGENGEDDDGTDGVSLIPAGSDSPGVTDESLVISFVVTDTSKVAAAFGWERPDEGDREAQIAALVEWVNARGGIAGRQIEAKVHVFDAITDGPIAEEALCNAITQDDKAFAVVLTGQFQENARPCYANANTLMLDGTLYPIDVKGYDDLAPYLWSPFLPTYDDLITGLAASLIDGGWFEDATVGVIAIQSELSQRVYDEQFLPLLTQAGIDVVSYNTIDPTDGASFDNDQLQAIVNFKEAGVDHVVAIGGSRLVSWFINTSITQNFEPRYAMSSYDSPDFNVFNYSDKLGGAQGVSVTPGFDIRQDQWPYPAEGAESECVEVFTNAGLAADDRQTVRTGLIYCDALRLLETAGESATELSATGLGEAIWAIGDSFDAASTYGVEFEPGQYAGGDLYVNISFDEGCGCLEVDGPVVDFDD